MSERQPLKGPSKRLLILVVILVTLLWGNRSNNMGLIQHPIETTFSSGDKSEAKGGLTISYQQALESSSNDTDQRLSQPLSIVARPSENVTVELHRPNTVKAHQKGRQKAQPKNSAAKKPPRFEPRPVPPPGNSSTAVITKKETRILYFLHIHKSAGTTMCEAAKMNQLKVIHKHNCNVQEDQRCCGGDDSLAAQQLFARTTQYQLVANEQDMYTAMDTEHYRYIVLLRHSQHRYKSHWKHVLRENPELAAKNPFGVWWQGQPDNWNVRKICGTRCMSIAKFQLTMADFEYALDRLRQFEDYLFVDNFDESYTKLAHSIGWTKMPVYTTAFKQAESTFTYPKDTVEWDSNMSALDDAMYDYAVDLYHGIQRPALSSAHEQASQRYFEGGPGQQCTNPCCAETCSMYR